MKNCVFILLLLLVPFFGAGCDSVARAGCMDPEAQNFNREASEDDNSCVFPADLSFYMETDEHGIVEIFVDDIFLGRLEGFYTGVPGSCDQPFTVTLAGVVTPAFDFSIKWTAVGEDGVVTGGTFRFLSRGCSFLRVF